MRYLLALLLTLCTLPTFADTSKGLCIPYLECQPLVTKAVRGPLATHVFWFVRGPRGTVLHQGFSCAAAACDLQTFMTAANSVITGKTAPAEALALVSDFTCSYASFEPNDDEHPICAERKDALMQKMDTWLAGIPAQIEWWGVKVNGTVGTRPAYTLAAGVRGTKEVARVAVGTPCNTARPTLASGKDLWAETGSPGVVALCQKVNP